MIQKIDIGKAIRKARKIVDIIDNQGRLKEFERLIKKMATSKSGLYILTAMPLLEILIDLELHLMKIEHTHQHHATTPKYRLDFYLDELGIGLEADEREHEHKARKAFDIERDLDIEMKKGIPVIRIKEDAICSNLGQAVKDAIIKGKARKEELQGTQHERWIKHFMIKGV